MTENWRPEAPEVRTIVWDFALGILEIGRKLPVVKQLTSQKLGS
jgi:hypothetical protein